MVSAASRNPVSVSTTPPCALRAASLRTSVIAPRTNPCRDLGGGITINSHSSNSCKLPSSGNFSNSATLISVRVLITKMLIQTRSCETESGRCGTDSRSRKREESPVSTGRRAG